MSNHACFSTSFNKGESAYRVVDKAQIIRISPSKVQVLAAPPLYIMEQPEPVASQLVLFNRTEFILLQYA